jgi:two-component system phosphate regulon sensor histidine kinase PhoR
MFHSIRWRIALPYVLLILITMLALGVYISNFVRQTYVNDLESKLASEAHMIGDVITPDLESVGEAPNLDSQAKHWDEILNARVTIIAPDGTVWGESEQDRATMANHSDRPEVIQALASGIGSSIRYSQTLGLDMLYTLAAGISECRQVAAGIDRRHPACHRSGCAPGSDHCGANYSPGACAYPICLEVGFQ